MVRVVWRVILSLCVVTTAAVLWVAAGGTFGVDRWLDVTSPPVRSEALVVLGGGTAGGNLPLPQGWDRLETAAQLFKDEFAPVVIFSGGGTSRVSEAEIYANAGAWLGIPRAAMLFESQAQSTKDHGAALLKVQLPDGRLITKDTPLLVVTSAFHSRRALMSFHRAGFTHVRIVARYASRRPAAAGTPAALRNTVATHAPSGKQYNDVLFRMAYSSFDLLIGLREVGAILAGG